MEVKKTLHDIFAFNSNSPQIEHIYKKYKHKEKNKTLWGAHKWINEGPKYFWNFLLSKRGLFGQISN
jgi:hypothetical protein